MQEAFGEVSATGKKNRSPNHKLLFQLRLSQQPGKTEPRIIFPRCLLEVGRNAKLVVEHHAKDVCFLFSSAVSCTNCFAPRRCGEMRHPFILCESLSFLTQRKRSPKLRSKTCFLCAAWTVWRMETRCKHQIASAGGEARAPRDSHVASHRQTQTHKTLTFITNGGKSNVTQIETQ